MDQSNQNILANRGDGFPAGTDLERHIQICRLLTRIARERGAKVGLSAPAYLAGVLDGVYPKIRIEVRRQRSGSAISPDL